MLNYLKILDFDNSKKWSTILFNCDKERIDDGEREFVAGRVFYEAGEREKAFEYFKTAFKKSRGHSFDNEDPEYLEFYKNPEI